MRFLIVPYAPNAYDRRMVSGLASGLRKIGHEAAALEAPVDAADAPTICREHSPDVLFEVNRCRSDAYPLPVGVRHIGWFQDPLIPANVRARVHGDDILYFLVDTLDFAVEVPCRKGMLFLGVDEDTLRIPKMPSSRVDFALCGFIPKPLPEWVGPGYAPPWFSEIAYAAAASAERHYRPLCGELDIDRLGAAIRADLRLDDAHIAGLRVFAREYPRLMDRSALIRKILIISRSLDLYGHFWESHPEFAPYWRGFLHEQASLYRTFRRSRINLANNTHGLGLHSRTLECMAVGGFILTHRSPSDGRPGGMYSAFEPGVHYGEFTPESIQEEATKWLRQAQRREQAGWSARAMVLQAHLWRNRAEQIVSDLKI